MIKIREAILVEGRYDKNTLCQIVDTLILQTDGFAIFNNSNQRTMIRNIAEARGLVVMTDPDSAGFLIRNYIRSFVPAEYLRHAYVPDILGKERRKEHASKEGKLGVEGMSPEILLHALRTAGVSIEGELCESIAQPVSKTDFYRLGLAGRKNSELIRKHLIQHLSLPENMTANALLAYINTVMDRDTFFSLEQKLIEKEGLDELKNN